MEREILEAFRRGERKALERVYREHRGGVESVVRRGLIRANHQTAANLADVVQEVFEKAFGDAARTRYDGQRSYARFLAVLARNVVVDWLRRSRREVMSHDHPALLDEVAFSAWHTSGVYERDRALVIHRYLGRVEPELRDVYQLRFIADEGQVRAAQRLGTSRQRLRTMERRLLDGLRQELRRQRSDSEWR